MRFLKKILKLRSTKPLLFILVFVAALGCIGGASYVFASYLGGGGPKTTGQTASINLNQGLVSYWPFNGNAKDATPYANNGILENAPTLTTDRKGQANSAYNFNGSTQYITTTNLLSEPTVYTLSLWFKTTSGYASGGRLFGFSGSQTGSSSNYDSHIYMTNSGQIYFGTYNTSVETVNSTASYNDGNWHDVTATLSSAGQFLYIDGQLVASNASNTTDQGFSGYWRIGYDNLTSWPSIPTSFFFNGNIDDVRVYSRVLSSAEVTALYNEYNPGIQVASTQSGLVGWWKMLGNPKDSSPYGNNGTVTGATLTTDRKGQANSAYSFNGSSNYINIPNSSSMQMSSAVTISAWVDPSSISGTRSILMKGQSGNNWDYGLALVSGVPTYTADAANLSYGSAISTSKWTQIVMTLSIGGSLTMYVNGQSVGSTSTPTNSSCSGTCLSPSSLSAEIGNANSASFYFAGSIGEVRVYNRALTSTEVTNLYQSYDNTIDISTLQSGLVGYWPFNGNLKDATPYGNNGTNNNTATLTTDRNGQPNGAYSFNGTNQYISIPTSFSLSGTFTVALWVDPNNTSTTCGLVGSRNPADTFDLKLQTGLIHGDIGNGSSWLSTTANANFSYSGGVWYDIVYEVTPTAYTIYANGALVGSGTISGTPVFANSSNPLWIADTGSASGGEFCHGSMDDVRVYNRTLSATEVSALYQEYR